MSEENRWLALAIAIMVGLLVYMYSVTFSVAHDHARPELNDWFNRLASGKGLCCSDHDGLMVPDVDWESKGGHYRVRLEGVWWDVPDDAVVTVPNRDGRTMVWPINGSLGTSIRCFMPGMMG